MGSGGEKRYARRSYLRGLLQQLVIGGLGEENLHVGKVTGVLFVPLLLALLTASRGGCGLGLLRLLLHLRWHGSRRRGECSASLAEAALNQRQPISAKLLGRARNRNCRYALP